MVLTKSESDIGSNMEYFILVTTMSFSPIMAFEL